MLFAYSQFQFCTMLFRNALSKYRAPKINQLKRLNGTNYVKRKPAQFIKKSLLLDSFSETDFKDNLPSY